MPHPPIVPPVAPAVADEDEVAHLDQLRAVDVLRDGVAHVGRLVRRVPVPITVAVLGALLFAGGVFATSVVIGNLTDALLVPVLESGEAAGPRLRTAVLAVLGVALWRATGITIRRAAATWASHGATADLRRRLLAHQLGLSLRWYARQRVGDLLAVNDTHVRTATNVLGPLPFSVGAVTLAVGAVVMVALLDHVLGIVVGVLVGAALVGELLAAWSTFAAFDLEQHRTSVVARVAHESIDGAQTVAALGRRDAEVRRFAHHVGRQRDAEVLVGRRWSWFRAMMEVLPSLVIVPVVVVGAVRVGAGALTVGDLVAIAYLLSLLSIPIAIIGFVVWDTAHALSGWRRLESVLRADERLAPGTRDHDVGGAASADVEEVDFAYDVAGEAVLRDVSLHLRSGATVALVGPTASGKSTLVALLARLWDPDAGRLLLDGQELRLLSDAARTAQVAHVGQDTFVFEDTVRGNVLLGHAVDDGRVWEALELAQAATFVRELPQGLDSPLGERGTTLSGGQRQRLGLARALVRAPRLLLLDDATSAVDPSVEARILRGLRASAAPSTVLLVASRPASVAACDEVLLLEQGRIVATGTHEHLLATVPTYRSLLQAYERDRS